MDYDFNKLEQALNYIKDICESNEYCNSCPLGKGDLCWLYEEPHTWNIKKIIYNK